VSEILNDGKCLVCNRDKDATPLVMLKYQDGEFRMCPQHLPVLIHDPTQLAGKLPGAEKLRPADIHD